MYSLTIVMKDRVLMILIYILMIREMIFVLLNLFDLIQMLVNF